MILKTNFNPSANKVLTSRYNKKEVSISLYKDTFVKRIFFCASADADLILDVSETSKLKETITSALIRCRKEERGFCQTLKIPHLGDFNAETIVVIQVVFANKFVGIAINFEDSSEGDELWLNEVYAKEFLDGIDWLLN